MVAASEEINPLSFSRYCATESKTPHTREYTAVVINTADMNLHISEPFLPSVSKTRFIIDVIKMHPTKYTSISDTFENADLISFEKRDTTYDASADFTISSVLLPEGRYSIISSGVLSTILSVSPARLGYEPSVMKRIEKIITKTIFFILQEHLLPGKVYPL
jgi:hypothetical protein